MRQSRFNGCFQKLPALSFLVVTIEDQRAHNTFSLIRIFGHHGYGKKTVEKDRQVFRENFFSGSPQFLFSSLLWFLQLSIFIKKKLLEEEAYQRAIADHDGNGCQPRLCREMYCGQRCTRLLDEDDFILEAMSSSYVSRAIMELVNEEIDDFSYRRVSVNARNPEYEAERA